MSADKNLISAVREGNIERVDQLIASSGLSNSLSWSDGYDLLREAIDNGHTEIVKLLLMNINTEVDSNRLALTPKGRDALSDIVNIVQFAILELTVINGDVEILQMLLDKGEKNGDLYVKPLLHVAVRNNKMAIVELLFNRGADVNFKSNGLTPLYIAVSEGSLEIAKYLLIKGARIDYACAVGPTRHTPLYLAIEKAHASLVKLLLARGASIDPRNKNQTNALKMAFHKGHSIITAYVYICCLDLKQNISRITLLNAVDRAENDYRVIFQRFFRTYNFDNFINRKSMLPILVHAAVQSGFIKIVQYFLTFGFEINAPTVHSPQAKERQSLLHSAVKNAQEDMAEFLIFKGSDLNAVDSAHRPPIFYAIEYVDVNMTNLLLCSGAKIKNCPYFLRSAAMSASREIVDLILEHDPDIDVNAKDSFGNTALHSASIGSLNENFDNSDRADIAKLLLSRGANVNARGYKDATPLHFAVQGGRVEVVEVLLSHDADVNVVAARDSDTTPLHECARYATGGASVAIVQMLLAKNTDVNAKTKKGKTALHHASERSNAEVVQILVKHGAEIDARSHDGMTALHCASIRGFVETIAVLLKYGSDINAKCNNGKTPFDYVIERFVNNEMYCSRRCRCKKLVNIFNQQIVKIRSANLYVCKENLDLLSRGKYKLESFEEACRKEIVRMKEKKICGNASFYDILRKNIHELSIYARYERVVETLEAKDWKEMFPMYYHMIWNNYKKGRSREILLNPSVNSFNFLIGQDLLDVLTIDIFRYLSDEDLGNLIKASQNCGSGERRSYVESTIKRFKNFFVEAKNFAMKSNKSFN